MLFCAALYAAPLPDFGEAKEFTELNGNIRCLDGLDAAGGMTDFVAGIRVAIVNGIRGTGPRGDIALEGFKHH